MGSILLASPMIRCLKENCKNAQLVLLTFAENKKFAEQLGLFDEVIALRTSSIFVFAFDVLRLLTGNLKPSFDVIFDLEFFSRFSTIISYLCGAKCRVGYYLPKIWRGNLLTVPVHFNPHKHVSEVFSAQLSPFGLNVTDYSLTAPQIEPNAIKSVKSFLENNHIYKDDLLISLNVNSSSLCLERRWPLENFRELILFLLSYDNVKIILVGSPSEKEYVDGLYTSLADSEKKRIVNTAGLFSLDKLVALLKLSDLFVTNDSGPLHIANALKTPTVSFFGPESPILYGPPEDDRKSYVFYADIYCSPCLNVYNAKTAMCGGDNHCMKEILVSDVKKLLKDEILPGVH